MLPLLKLPQVTLLTVLDPSTALEVGTLVVTGRGSGLPRNVNASEIAPGRTDAQD